MSSQNPKRAIYEVLRKAQADGTLSQTQDARALARFFLGVAAGINAVNKSVTDPRGVRGYGQSRDDRLGYLQPVLVAETDEQAYELGKCFMFGGGFAHFARPEWMFPPGYNSKDAIRRLASQAANPNLPSSPFQRDPANDDEVKELKRSLYAGYDNWHKQGQVVTGSPKTVVRKLRHILEVLRPGIFSFWLDGPIPLEARRTCVRLIGQEVLPELREIGKELGLEDPFTRTPGSVHLNGREFAPVGNAALLDRSTVSG